MNKGYVYFIQLGEDGPIKIGWTGRTVAIRLRELCARYPWLSVKFLGKIPGELYQEKSLHNRFKKHMIVPEVPHGVKPIIETELFLPSKSLLKYVGNLRDKSLV